MSDKEKQKACWQKKRFYNMEDAKKSYKLIKKRYGHKLEIYQCPFCKFYHLSSEDRV